MGILVSTFDREGNRGTEKLNNLLKVTWLGSSKVCIPTPVTLLQRLLIRTFMQPQNNRLLLPHHWMILTAQISCVFFFIQTLFPSNSYFEGDLTIIIFFPQWDVFIFKMQLHIPRISFPSQDIFPEDKYVVCFLWKKSKSTTQEQQHKTPTSWCCAIFATQRPWDPRHSLVDPWETFPEILGWGS